MKTLLKRLLGFALFVILFLIFQFLMICIWLRM